MHRTESRFVKGFGKYTVCRACDAHILQPGHFTGLGSEGVTNNNSTSIAQHFVRKGYSKRIHMHTRTQKDNYISRPTKNRLLEISVGSFKTRTQYLRITFVVVGCVIARISFYFRNFFYEHISMRVWTHTSTPTKTSSATAPLPSTLTPPQPPPPPTQATLLFPPQAGPHNIHPIHLGYFRHRE